MEIRPGDNQDMEFIREMLFEAFFWMPQRPRPGIDEFFNDREFSKLFSNWGRNGDRTVIAENGKIRIGAAWFRLWTESNHSYGFIDSTTPELGIGVHPGYRSKGIGRILLNNLIEQAKNDGIDAISLSVEPSNFARKLYESEGFLKVAESGASLTYMIKLTNELRK